MRRALIRGGQVGVVLAFIAGQAVLLAWPVALIYGVDWTGWEKWKLPVVLGASFVNAISPLHQAAGYALFELATDVADWLEKKLVDVPLGF